MKSVAVKFALDDSVIIPDTRSNRFSMSSPEHDGIGLQWTVAGINIYHTCISYLLVAKGRLSIIVEEKYLEAV
jgi:hypothetical protein